TEVESDEELLVPALVDALRSVIVVDIGLDAVEGVIDPVAPDDALLLERAARAGNPLGLAGKTRRVELVALIERSRILVVDHTRSVIARIGVPEVGLVGRDLHDLVGPVAWFDGAGLQVNTDLLRVVDL